MDAIEEHWDEIESLRSEINEQVKHMQVSTLLSLLYTAEIVNKYIYLKMSQRPLPLSQAGVNVLHNLILNGGMMSPSKLGNKVFRSKYAISRIFDTLEKKSLVLTTSSRDDRRMKTVIITNKGLQYIKTVSTDGRKNTSREVFYEFEDKELIQLRKMLKKISDHLLPIVNNYNKK